MFKRLRNDTRLWNDTHGGVISPEVCLVGAILIIGVIVGISALKVAILTETEDIGRAVEAIDFTPTVGPPTICSPPPVTSSSPTTMSDLLDDN